MTTFLDTNVVVALLKADDTHHEWSVAETMKRKEDGPLIVCDIVFCEVSVTMENVDEVNAALSRLGIDRLPETDDALFAAGKAFKEYKANKGPKDGVLPDLLVGATAFCEDAPLVTADPRRYRTYFPELIISIPPKPIPATIEGTRPAVTSDINMASKP